MLLGDGRVEDEAERYEGNHHEKLGLKSSYVQVNGTIAITAVTSPNPEGNKTDTSSSKSNRVCHTPDFSYPLSSSI